MVGDLTQSCPGRSLLFPDVLKHSQDPKLMSIFSLSWVFTITEQDGAYRPRQPAFWGSLKAPLPEMPALETLSCHDSPSSALTAGTWLVPPPVLFLSKHASPLQDWALPSSSFPSLAGSENWKQQQWWPDSVCWSLEKRFSLGVASVCSVSALHFLTSISLSGSRLYISKHKTLSMPWEQLN